MYKQLFTYSTSENYQAMRSCLRIRGVTLKAYTLGCKTNGVKKSSRAAVYPQESAHYEAGEAELGTILDLKK